MTKQRKKLINRRIELNKTQQQVADEANISRAYYTNIELGVKDPSLEVAIRIAKVLEQTVEYLFFNHEVPKRNKSEFKIKPTGTTG